MQYASDKINNISKLQTSTVLLSGKSYLFLKFNSGRNNLLKALLTDYFLLCKPKNN